jgi:hypothetical protein
MQPLHSIAVSLIPSVPAEPAIILYDQMNNPAPTPTPPAPGGVTSQDFEPELDSYDSFAADDFVVPAGQIWISLKWMSSANIANLPSSPIRSMFFSTQIAARCQERWLQAGSPTHSADSNIS